MKMRVRETIGMGEPVTPPLSPLSHSLFSSSLLSHCSSCFRPLDPSSSPVVPTVVPTPGPTTVLYCSPRCSASHSPLHFSSASHLLDCHLLRAALRLLHLLHLFPHFSRHRIGGILTNHERLMSDEEMSAMIREGARDMGEARAARDGREWDGECGVEMAALCAVMTNAVEVRVSDVPVGVGVYGTGFSWIDHSCVPNCCYRFQYWEEEEEGVGMMRICPDGDDDDGIVMEENSAGSSHLLPKGVHNFGPRLTCRTIKAVARGEEVTITYTDLLQPREVRQSELWSKYQFLCRCRRCTASPQTYIDQCLQEIFPSRSWDGKLYVNDDIQWLRDYFDDTITSYMSDGNAALCCEKIEKLPMRGINLSPLHHLSLSAYTTLYSAYKVQALENSSCEESQVFHSLRTSTAYSMLLAGATHHLFLHESSIIATAATFWTSAGESLINLTRSSLWDLLEPDLPSVPCHKCLNCLLLDRFKASFSSTGTKEEEVDEVSRRFLNCISSICPAVWGFLVYGCHCLEDIKDPIDFSWLEDARTSYNKGTHGPLYDHELHSSYLSERIQS